MSLFKKPLQNEWMFQKSVLLGALDIFGTQSQKYCK